MCYLYLTLGFCPCFCRNRECDQCMCGGWCPVPGVHQQYGGGGPECQRRPFHKVRLKILFCIVFGWLSSQFFPSSPESEPSQAQMVVQTMSKKKTKNLAQHEKEHTYTQLYSSIHIWAQFPDNDGSTLVRSFLRVIFRTIVAIKCLSAVCHVPHRPPMCVRACVCVCVCVSAPRGLLVSTSVLTFSLQWALSPMVVLPYIKNSLY